MFEEDFISQKILTSLLLILTQNQAKLKSLLLN